MSYEQAKALIHAGPSRPTLYSVNLGSKVSFLTNQYLKFFCSATAIPGVRTNTSIAAGQEYMGITREMPTAVIYSKPLTITVIENANFSVYKDIRRWFDTVCENANQVGARRSQRMNYYNTYTADITLTKLEQSSLRSEAFGFFPGDTNYKPVLDVNFINAYPTDIGAITLNSAGVNEYTTFDVSFTYESYSLNNTPII